MSEKLVLLMISIAVTAVLVAAPNLRIIFASPYVNIDVETAYNMITNGSYPDLVVLDVRTQSEYDSGHIYGAVWIPHTELKARISELVGHEDHEIIVYCRSGVRSVNASETLDSFNFTKVYNMLGGILAWESGGYPVWIATVHNLNTTFNYDTIQAAIDAPQTLDGHTIFVEEGIYYESVLCSKSISLVGKDSGKTIIDGNQTGQGVHIMADNVLLCNLTIQECRNWGLNSAILIERSSNCRILDTMVINNTKGIFLLYSTNSTISGNFISNCELSFGVHGEELIDFMHSIDSSNLVDGKPVYYLLNQTNVTINPSTHPNVGYLALVNSFNVTVEGLELMRNLEGLVCAYTTKSTITGVSVVSNIIGLDLTGSSNNTISKNNIIDNGFGLGVVGGGVVLAHSSDNSIIENQIVENNYYGILVSDSYHNSIYHSCFVENRNKEVWSLNSANVWDNGYPSGGNYWSDYKGPDLFSGHDQNETGSDGLGDTGYAIDGNNTDHYPLMGMFSDFKATPEHDVQTICNSTLSAFQFNGTAILFNVSGENDTAGFCRICIPTDLMNDTYKIFVNGTEVMHILLPCSNKTHSYLYFAYNHSAQEVVIIPEFPSPFILPLFMIAVLLAVVIYRRKYTI